MLFSSFLRSHACTRERERASAFNNLQIKLLVIIILLLIEPFIGKNDHNFGVSFCDELGEKTQEKNANKQKTNVIDEAHVVRQLKREEKKLKLFFCVHVWRAIEAIQ